MKGKEIERDCRKANAKRKTQVARKRVRCQETAYTRYLPTYLKQISSRGIGTIISFLYGRHLYPYPVSFPLWPFLFLLTGKKILFNYDYAVRRGEERRGVSLRQADRRKVLVRIPNLRRIRRLSKFSIVRNGNS